jgi:hypothetical protein
MIILWVYSLLIAIAFWPIFLGLGAIVAKTTFTIPWWMVVLALPGQSIVIHYILVRL